jgi:hypothetical protein
MEWRSEAVSFNARSILSRWCQLCGCPCVVARWKALQAFLPVVPYALRGTKGAIKKHLLSGAVLICRSSVWADQPVLLYWPLCCSGCRGADPFLDRVSVQLCEYPILLEHRRMRNPVKYPRTGSVQLLKLCRACVYARHFELCRFKTRRHKTSLWYKTKVARAQVMLICGRGSIKAVYTRKLWIIEDDLDKGLNNNNYVNADLIYVTRKKRLPGVSPGTAVVTIV